MNNSAVEKVVKEMEKSGALTEKEYTPQELTEQLLAFQKMLATMLYDDSDKAETVRMSEIIYYLEANAREKNLSGDPVVRQGIQALKRIDKEISISVAGRNGEGRVARTLSFVQRPDARFFNNVYVSNDESETEIDNIILTKEGIIILEVKNAKEDITITEDGRLLYSNEECYHEKSICDKMNKKRQLIKERLLSEMSKKGIDMPIFIDSYLVFSAPKNVYIKITDNCRREKYCFRGKLPEMIDAYIGRVTYSDEQLAQLTEILSTIECNRKKFSLKIDYDEIRKNIADIFCKLFPERFATDDISEKKLNIDSKSNIFVEKVEKPEKKIVNIENRQRKKKILSAACFASAFLVPAVGIAATLLASSISGDA